MIGLKINSEYFDLYPNTKIRMVWVNPLFSDEIGRPSFSYQFTLPFSEKNARLLKHAQVVMKRGRVTTYDNVELEHTHVPLERGLLEVKEAGPSQDFLVTFATAEGRLNTTLKKDLVSYQLGGVRQISVHPPDINGTQDMIDHANDTTTGGMDDFDYVFFPIKNSLFYPADWKIYFSSPLDWTNYYWQGSFHAYDEFNLSDGVQSNWGICPYPYLMYVLRQIFAEDKFFLAETAFLNDAELKTLVIYNNHSLDHTVGATYNTSVNLQNHVPDVTASAFVKGVLDLFGLGLFIKNNTVTLLSKNEILSDQDQVDWTEKGLTGYRLIFEEKKGFSFFSDQDPDDERNGSDLVKDEGPESVAGAVDTVGDLPAATQSGDIYKVKVENALYRDTGTWEFYSYDLFPVNTGNGEEEDRYSIISTAEHHFYDGVVQYGNLNGRTPWIEQPGAGGAWIEGLKKFSARLLFYRGMQEDDVTYGPYPQGLADDDDGAYTYSLYWHGDQGLYETWHKRWTEMLEGSESFDYLAKLDLADIRNLAFHKKHRIRTEEGDAVVYIKSVETELSMTGISASKLDLVRP